MQMGNTSGLVSFVLVSAMLAGAGPALSAKNDMLVVPARQRMVDFAFDVQALRKVVLVSYRGNASSRDPLLHVWDPRRGEWRRIMPEEFAVGSFMASSPGTMYLVGSDSDLPSIVAESSAQAGKVVRINTLNIGEAANTLNGTMKFSQREWKTLADRHGLQTRDLNEDRRKWGRFGPPGTRIEPPAPTSVPVAFPEEEFPEDATPVPAAPVDATEAAEAPAAIVEEPVVFLPDPEVHLPLEPDSMPEPIEPVAVEEKGMPAATPEIEVLPPVAADPLPEDK